MAASRARKALSPLLALAGWVDAKVDGGGAAKAGWTLHGDDKGETPMDGNAALPALALLLSLLPGPVKADDCVGGLTDLDRAARDRARGRWSRSSQSLADRDRINRAREIVGSPLTDEQGRLVLEAHNVGRGETGLDGKTPAGVGNYTRDQIREKARILRTAGFNPAQIRRMMDKGVAGEPRRAVGGVAEVADAVRINRAEFADSDRINRIEGVVGRPLTEREMRVVHRANGLRSGPAGFGDHTQDQAEFAAAARIVRAEFAAAARINRAREAIGRPFTERERRAVHRANGLYGAPAGFGDYTQEQIDHVMWELRWGFNREETRRIMEAGVVGKIRRKWGRRLARAEKKLDFLGDEESLRMALKRGLARDAVIATGGGGLLALFFWFLDKVDPINGA